MEKQERFKRIARLCRIFLLRFGILTLFSIFLTWFIEYRYFSNNADKAWTFMDENPLVFWYTALIMFTIMMLFYGIFRGPFKSMGITFSLVAIFTYINISKFEFRGTPVLPEDFQLTDQAGTLTKFIDIGVLIRLIIAVIISIGLGFLLDYLTKDKLNYLPIIDKNKKLRTKKARAERKKEIRKRVILAVAMRIVIIPISIISFLNLTDFVRNHTGAQGEDVEWLETSFNAWSQNENYNKNGLILGFLYNIHKSTAEKPEDYSSETISKIKDSYSNNKNNTTEKDLKDVDYNIVIILNESFYDLSIVSDYYDIIGDDPIPNWHEIQEKYPNGYMYSPDYGGGTANVEFEVLTGLSNYWTDTVPYTDILTKIKDVTSIGKDAKDAGYKTTAVHSFTGEMYKREINLAKEGFDDFITENEMHYTEKEGNSDYIKDSELYHEVLDLLQSEKQKQLIFAITMQNHAPYNLSRYDEDEYKHGVETEDEYQRGFIVAYLKTLHNADNYLGEFLEKLNNSNEKTVVLFFGDHAPGVLPDVHENEEKSTVDLSHLTPYFIWTNFNIDKSKNEITNKKETGTDNKEEVKDEKEETDDDQKEDKELSKSAKDFLSTFNVPEKFKETAKKISLPTTTPNCLVNTLYNYLKLKKTTQQNLLDQVCTKTPILAPEYLTDNPPENEKAFKEYELLNYDILGGQQYWLK